MGGLCSCLNSTEEPHCQHEEEATARTPLLAGTESTPRTQLNGKSARNTQIERPEFLTSVESLSPVSCTQTVLPVLDKTFQDHSKLYNDLLKNFSLLGQTLDEMKQLVARGQGVRPSLETCVKHIAGQCCNAELKVKRSKYCIQIEYDPKDVSENTTMEAEDAIEILQLYNKANKLCRDILEKSPRIKLSIEMVLQDEKGLRLEIMKSNLGGSEAPEAMKICIANINKFRRLPGATETIHRHTERTFNDIKEASKVLFTES